MSRKIKQHLIQDDSLPFGLRQTYCRSMYVEQDPGTEVCGTCRRGALRTIERNKRLNLAERHELQLLLPFMES